MSFKKTVSSPWKEEGPLSAYGGANLKSMRGGEIVDFVNVFEFESERIWAEEILPILRKLPLEEKRNVIASIDAYVYALEKENKR